VIAAALSSRMPLKHIVIVDDDIDIHNPLEVEWAVSTRSQFDLDSYQLSHTPAGLDPSAPVKRGDAFCHRVGIDATKPLGKEFPTVCDVPADELEKVSRDWEAYITPRERVTSASTLTGDA
jgi:2,5-furandicarboxylate decarboxylase 1